MQFVARNSKALMAVIIAVFVSCISSTASITVPSPGGKVSTVVSVSSGKLYYRLFKGGKPALDTSSLGITINNVKLGENVTAIAAGPSVEVSRSYAYRGICNTATDHCNEVTIAVSRTGAGDQSFEMVFRAYDDGVAYRYRVPGSGTRNVNGEASNWVVPSGTYIWYQPTTTYYEGTYRGDYIDDFYSWIGMPATLKLAGGSYATGYALINESALFGYSGMSIKKMQGSRVLQGVFEDDNYNPLTPYPDYCLFSVQGGSYSPWRVTLLVDDLNQLVNSTLVDNLAAPPSPELAGAAWIKPGKCLWSWWAYDDVYTNPDRQKSYTDYAVTLGFDSVLWDEGWKTWSDSKINELLTYAKNRNKTVWLWKKCGEVWSDSAMETFLQYIDGKNTLMGRKIVVGIKVDFMNSESRGAVQFYEMAMRKTAEHQLMINFHGANKPTGESITYPNEITREGVMGLEYNKWTSGLLPSHNCILPFTRNVVGHMDYTPCSLKTSATSPHPGPTTHCHQLATAIIFTSPLTHWAEDPYYYVSSPAVDIIKSCPTTWNETRVLPMSDIGKLAVFARRKNNDWYLAAINGELATAKNTSLPVSFLGDGVYEAITFSDNPANAYSMTKAVRYYCRYDTLIPWIGGGAFPAPVNGQQYGGGYVARFQPTTGLNTYKLSADGTAVTLKGRTVTAAFSGYLYVEEPNRTSGIRVSTSQTGFVPGDAVTITGTMSTRKSGSIVMERQINAAAGGIVKQYSATPIKPMAMLGRNLGGTDVAGGQGPGTVGLLVKITGRLSYKSGDMMYVDDAGGVIDPNGYSGVAVKYSSTTIPYIVGDYVSVVGVEEGSIVGSETRNRRYVRARTASDVVKLD